MYCVYYQAHVKESECWYFVAILRSFEHLVFDRTYDKQKSIFEFLVPEHMEDCFLQVMDYFTCQSIVWDIVKLPNRLLDPAEQV